MNSKNKKDFLAGHGEIGQVRELGDVDFAKEEITNQIPARFASSGVELFPPDLVGATIVTIGSLKNQSLVEGGGLVIDYRAKEAEEVTRLVLGFSELGMYLQSRLQLRKIANQASGSVLPAGVCRDQPGTQLFPPQSDGVLI